MRRPGRGLIAGVAVLAVPALASATLASPVETPPGTIVFVSNLSPAATAEGRRIGESRVHSFSIDGETRLDVTGAAGYGSDQGVALSPDGRTIAFLRTRRGSDGAELWLADADGRNARRLLSPEPLESFTFSDSEPYFQGPAWSPRGDVVALDVVSTASCLPGYTKCASWYTRLVPVDGRATRITGGLNASWSPAGQVLVRAGLFSLEEPEEWILAVDNADGSEAWQTDDSRPWKRRDSCWSGGSWSFDGARIILVETDCDGTTRRLHVVDAQTGERLSVLRGCCASWAPSGQRLAYVAFDKGGNEITIANADGRRPRRIAHGSLPGWSPTGSRLAYLRRAGARDELVIARSDGRRPRVVAQGSRNGVQIGAWSPDGSRFAFTRRTGDRTEITVTRGDGTAPRIVARQPRRAVVLDRWAPDNRRLVYWDAREGTAAHLRVVDTETARIRMLYRSLEGAYAFSVGWRTGTGALLVVEAVGGLYPEELWTVRADGSGLRRLTRNRRGELDPAWSPDGSRIAFWRDDPRAGKKPEDLSVYVMRSNGSAVRKVVGGAQGRYASDPDWSPDGGSLAVVRWLASGHQDIWVVGLDGRRARRVTRTGHGFAPAWTPDGKAIAFSDDGAPTLVSPVGNRQRRLLAERDANQCSGFAWSPDGRRVAASCGIPGGLVLATADGAEFRSIDRWADRAPSWSPDGEWLVYQAPSGLRIVDAAGDTPTEIDLRGATASQPDWSPR